ncbi:unnamed protein product [Acanthoscelides obtectus]|uniref:Cytochrome P450 n=1 Tax=Acanthoscelides obtectus TaxID=200917 RepID=A0A9P0KCK3_ACAOB|nr:unnamed protein product [Acanthoscelides obtectus]CAK1660936.1 Cytochrome P450 4V2 [Acanthoscelides obtectus]
MSSLINTNYLLIICFSVLCVLYVDRWIRRKLFPHSQFILGPFALPVVGGIFHLVNDSANVLRAIIRTIDSYQDIVKLWLGYRLLYVLKKPEYIEKVITNPNALNKDFFYEPLVSVLGDGLVTLGGAKWRRHRKLINPSFNQKILDNFVELFNERANHLVKILEETVGERNVPLYDIIGACVVDLSCQTAMGVNMSIGNVEKRVGEVLEKLNELSTERSLKLWNHIEVIWLLSGKKAQFNYYIKRLRSIVNEVIQKKMQDEDLKELRRDESVIANDGYDSKRRAFLDILLTQTDLNEKEIRDEVNTFLVAATRTTTNTLTAIFTVLGIYQDVQRKVYQEIVDVVGVEGEIRPEHLQRLEYTERVIKETLRVFPAVGMFSRYVAEDIDLGNNVKIEKGASAAVPVVYMHRCDKFWTDAMKFNPDRFLPGTSSRHPYTYLPFSQGPRNCIGGRYVTMLMKVVVALAIRPLKVFSEYKSIEEISLKLGILVRMTDGPKVWFQRRVS